MMTRVQAGALSFIAQRIAASGQSPSYDEIAAGLGMKSKSQINRLVVALEERGFIRRLPGRARCIEVIRLPDALAPKLVDRTIDAERARCAAIVRLVGTEHAGVFVTTTIAVAAIIHGTAVEDIGKVL